MEFNIPCDQQLLNNILDNFGNFHLSEPFNYTCMRVKHILFHLKIRFRNLYTCDRIHLVLLCDGLDRISVDNLSLIHLQYNYRDRFHSFHQVEACVGMGKLILHSTYYLPKDFHSQGKFHRHQLYESFSVLHILDVYMKVHLLQHI